MRLYENKFSLATAQKDQLMGGLRGGGEHSATPGTFFVFGSSNKK